MEKIKKGVKVEILTTKEKKRVVGIVEDVGVKKEGKPLMVRLKTGEVGRINKIIEEKRKTEIEELIKKGENQRLEFKSEALWSLNYNEKESKSYELRTYKQKASKVIIAKSLSALMNSEGGILVIGVKENKEISGYEIIGIEKDLEKLKELKKDFSIDGYKRMIIDEIIRPFFHSKIYNKINFFLEFKFEVFEGKTVCLIKVNSSNFPVFLSLEGREIFMIRTETQTRQIQDKELVDYCMDKFK